MTHSLTCRISILVISVLFCTNSTRAQQSISLAGKWAFKVDSANIGEIMHWEGDKYAQPIFLPGSTDLVGTGNSLPVYRNALGIKPPKDYPKNADYGMLTRIHKYTGKVWFQREILIPEKWKNYHIAFYMERVLWRSKVWVDGKQLSGAVDFLNTPHLHDLGVITPGKHIITVKIDNNEIYPVGILAHDYDNHTQTVWNGMVGQIALIAKPPVSFKNVRIFPSFKNKNIKFDITLINHSGHTQVPVIDLIIRKKKSGAIVANRTIKVTAKPDSSAHQYEIQLSEAPLSWDEFSAELYTANVTIKAGNHTDYYTADFGFRDIGTKEKHLAINDRKLFVRFSNESMFYPQTGFPAMDLAYWKNVFSVYKEHGLNGVRFHSSCPPEAAFQAADELGIYLQVEFFWMDGWMGLPALLGGKNDSLNNFARAEMRNALDTYGNHPSMMLVLYGNEMGGDFNKMGKWIGEEKSYDPRHYYAVGAAHNITPEDDFVEYGGKGDVAAIPNTDWDYQNHFTDISKHPYDKEFLRRNLPEYAHEMGQYIVHPVWSEIAKYKGVLRPYNMEYFRKLAKRSGIANQDTSFQKASGQVNKMLYKAEIEAQLRTRSNAGYSLLSMVDYPGQGEAYIGWVDVFYKNKNFISPQQFKQYGSYTVPLVRLSKFVWTSGEELNASIEVANYGPSILKSAVVKYSFLDDKGKMIESGQLSPHDIAQGEITTIGSIKQILTTNENGSHVKLKVTIANTNYANEWDLWVFPKPASPELPKDILITDNFKDALTALKQGRKVLFAAYKSGVMNDKRYASFAPVFWSATWFSGQETEVSGAVIQNKHPAFKKFPTGDVMDWQWFDLCKEARGFELKGLPMEFRPIVQPVDDYHFGKKLGSIFELKTVQGGKLLVCGYNIMDSLDYRPSSRQLRYSLLAYMQSSQFKPQQDASDEWLTNTFADRTVSMKKPPEFKNAYLYVEAGQHDEQPNVDIPWSQKTDGVIKDDGIDYKVTADGTWKDDGGAAWFGKKIHLEITVKSPRLMELKIRFHDWNNAGRDGVVSCEDKAPVTIGKHADGKWITFPISRENCLDGKIDVEIKTTSGPNLMITQMVLLPKE
jgi:beta-galactosidase